VAIPSPAFVRLALRETDIISDKNSFMLYGLDLHQFTKVF